MRSLFALVKGADVAMSEARLGRKPVAMVDVNLAFLVFLMQTAKLAALLVQQHPAFYRKKI